MNTEPMDEPGKKMRKLLGSSSPLMRLPKKNTNIKEDEGAEAPPKQDNAPPRLPTHKDKTRFFPQAEN